MLKKIESLARAYSISYIEVTSALRKAVEQTVCKNNNQELDTFIEDDKLFFKLRTYCKKDISMGTSGGADAIEEIIDITHAPDVYEEILIIFNQELEKISLQNQYLAVVNAMKKNDSRIVECTITSVTKHGLFLSTRFGTAFCLNKHLTKYEREKNIYKKDRVIRCHLLSAKIKANKLHINVSRTHLNLTKFYINGIFSDNSLIYSVKRKPGAYIKMIIDRKPTPNLINKLKYYFGNEKIIYEVRT